MDGEVINENECSGQQGDRRYSLRKRKSSHSYDSSFVGRNVLDDGDLSDEFDVDSVNGDVKLINQPDCDESGVTRSEVFPFKTPKRHNQMNEVASLSATKSQKKASLKCCMPSRNASSEKSNIQLKKGPQMKNPAANRLTRSMLNQAVDDSFSSGESESSDQSSDEDTDVVHETNRENVADLVEEYFMAHGNSKVMTSDHTLSNLDQPKIDKLSLREILKETDKKHQPAANMLNEKHVAFFKGWKYQLENGYNILTFGFGSKYKLLTLFQNNHLSNRDCIVVNGFFPNITIKQVLNTISDELLNCSDSFTSQLEQLDFIKKSYDNQSTNGKKNKLFIIVHNIDGPTLRRGEDQYVLAVLAAVPQIHVIASVDHINATLLWDQTKSRMFSWLWYDVTNFEQYLLETTYENSLLVQHSGQLVLSSLSHVFRSLTPNAQEIFLLLAKDQLASKDSSTNYIGLSFQDYYQKCREAFLVNSDLTLRAQLTEFHDHKLIRSKKSTDGVEHLIIPLDNATLDEFYKQQE